MSGEKANLLDGCQIKVKGLLSEVQHYETKEGKHYYSFILIVPGSTPLKVGMQDGAKPEVMAQYQACIGNTYTCSINVRSNQHGTFFEEVK
jgi:hypothetical protein